MPGMPDFDRPLTARGERAARRMGWEAARRQWKPAAILCSPAARTRATLRLFRRGWAEAGAGLLPNAAYDDAFYLAPAETWLARLRALARARAAALVIGHNPGLHALAQMLSGAGTPEDRARLDAGFPTCALAVIDFEGMDWKAVAPGTGRLRHLVLPRALLAVRGGDGDG